MWKKSIAGSTKTKICSAARYSVPGSIRNARGTSAACSRLPRSSVWNLHGMKGQEKKQMTGPGRDPFPVPSFSVAISKATKAANLTQCSHWGWLLCVPCSPGIVFRSGSGALYTCAGLRFSWTTMRRKSTPCKSTCVRAAACSLWCDLSRTSIFWAIVWLQPRKDWR